MKFIATITVGEKLKGIGKSINSIKLIDSINKYNQWIQLTAEKENGNVQLIAEKLTTNTEITKKIRENDR